jgi:very-long-chain (3R)-3-hydroxyacyl-CoA dehydratase
MNPKSYLFFYNTFLAIGWAVYLLLFIFNGLELNSNLFILLAVVQCAAVLEIVHAATGLVKSPVLITTLQVFSRVFVVFLIYLLDAKEYFTVLGINGLIIVSFAWSITEVVRYSLYAASLKGKEPSFLIFARYTFFIVLYPIGVTGEAMIGLSKLIATHWEMNLLNLAIIAIFGSYLFFFPKLYLYMFAQRKKKVV